jgi:ParB family chromosome partitioning protein
MMEKRIERRGLGRGLSALMADVNADSSAIPNRRPDLLVPVEKVFPNPDQPRRDFSAESLADLAASIRAQGIIQPLIVRPRGEGDYEIVAGERRWRAAQLALLHEIPVIVRSLSDDEMLQVAIVENIQRADLNPIEEAHAYRQLMDRFGHTQEKVSEALAKSRSYIANLLRLLQLPEDVQAHLREGRLSAGHARALITTPNPSELARQVIARGLTVRQTEELAKSAASRSTTPRTARPHSEKDADTRALEADLSANLGMSVSIDHEAGGNAGLLRIRYNSLDDLDLLCRALSVLPRDGSL